MNKEFLDLSKKMNSMGISAEERREIFRKNYSFLGRFFGYADNINKGISEAYDKKLSGLEAHAFLRKYHEDYDNRLLSSWSSNKNNLAYGNGNF